MASSRAFWMWWSRKSVTVPTLSRRSPARGGGVSADTNCCQCDFRADAAPAYALPMHSTRSKAMRTRFAIAALAAATLSTLAAAQMGPGMGQGMMGGQGMGPGAGPQDCPMMGQGMGPGMGGKGMMHGRGGMHGGAGMMGGAMGQGPGL